MDYCKQYMSLQQSGTFVKFSKLFSRRKKTFNSLSFVITYTFLVKTMYKFRLYLWILCCIYFVTNPKTVINTKWNTSIYLHYFLLMIFFFLGIVLENVINCLYILILFLAHKLLSVLNKNIILLSQLSFN